MIQVVITIVLIIKGVLLINDDILQEFHTIIEEATENVRCRIS